MWMRKADLERRKVQALWVVGLVMLAAFVALGAGVTRTRPSRRLTMRNNREPVGPGEESVWDYPRPPRLEPSKDRVRVEFNGVTIADSTGSYRMLETSHPPVYYIPIADCKMEYFSKVSKQTYCEFKGAASYFDLSVNGRSVRSAAWTYPKVTDSKDQAITQTLAVYPGKMDACYVNDEKVIAQEGDFYGGWITKKIKGPFKGGAGTWGW